MPSEGVKHKILLMLISMTIIGEVFSIIMWSILPESRISILDVQFGTINAAIMIPLNLLAFYWIIKGKKWAPLYFIAISIGNRLWSQPLFDGGIHMIFVTWTTILVVFAYNEYRGLSNYETAFLSIGAISNLALSAFLFNPVDSLTYGLIFYLAFLTILIGTVIALRKLR